MASAWPIIGNSFIRQIVGDAGKVFALKILAAVLNYGTIIFLAHWLNTASYGRYGTIMSAVTFGAVLCGLGANTAVIRFLGEYRAKSRGDLAWGVITYSESVVLRATLGCAALLSVGALAGAALGVFETIWVYIAAAFLILPGFTLMEVQNGILRSYDNIPWALIPKDFGWRITLIAASFAIYLSVVPEGRLLAVVLASGSALTLAALIQRIYLRRYIGRLEPPVPAKKDVKVWKQTSLTIWITQLARTALGTVDVLIVGALLSIEAAALYFVVVRTAEVIIFLTACLNIAVGPMIARHFAEGSVEKVKQVLAVAAILMSTVTGCAFLVCVIAGREVLGIFGPEYVAGYSALVFLVSGQLVCALLGTGETLVMTGNERINAKLLLVMSPVTLAGVVVMTPLYGLEGAALASGLGLAVWSILVWRAVTRLTPFDPSIFHGVRLLWSKRRELTQP